MINRLWDKLRKIKDKYYVASKYFAELYQKTNNHLLKHILGKMFKGVDHPASTRRLTGKKIQDLNVVSILDEFSFESYKYEFNLKMLPHINWKKVLTKDTDLFFCESSWAGSGRQWSLKKPMHRGKLKRVLRRCRKLEIPTVFWCKEDPVHFNMFLKPASRFDWIFTTDERCVPKYQEIFGHDRVHSLSFAVQPKVHNPFYEMEREAKVCFAGSYYTKKYPERGQALRDMFDASIPYGLVIFDRNSAGNHPFYKFPQQYKEFLRPRLPYSEIIKAYKGYAMNININTVTDSNTMFSRRVYELLACGTPVVSNPSLGMQKLFDTVIVCGSVAEYEKRIGELMQDKKRWQEISRKGVRDVLKGHTYHDRALQILSDMGARAVNDEDTIALFADLGAQKEDAEDWISRQIKKPDMVFDTGNTGVAQISGCTVLQYGIDDVRKYDKIVRLGKRMQDPHMIEELSLLIKCAREDSVALGSVADDSTLVNVASVTDDFINAYASGEADLGTLEVKLYAGMEV